MTGIILCKRVMRFFQNRDVAAFPQSEVYGPFVCHSLLNPFSMGLYLNAQGVYDLPEKKKTIEALFVGLGLCWQVCHSLSYVTVVSADRAMVC